MITQNDQEVSSESTQLELAVTAWRLAIGVENVDTRKKNLQIAETATFAVECNINAILYPLDQKEVIVCVQIAGTIFTKYLSDQSWAQLGVWI